MREVAEKELENKSRFNESMIKVIFRVMKYMKPYLFLAILGVALLFVNVFFNIKVVLIIKELTDAISQKDLNKISSLLKFYVPFSIFFILLMCTGNFIRGYVQNLVNRDLCSELYNKINTLPYRHIQGTHTGDLVERVNKDVDQAVGLIGGTVFSLFENIFICIGAFLYLTSISLPLSLLVLITGPITFVVGRIFDSRIRKIGKDIQDKGGEVRGVLQEFLQGMAVVRAFNMEEDFHNRFMNSREGQIHIMKKRTLLTVVMWRIVVTTNVTATLFIIYFVAMSTINGKLAIGSTLAFVFLMGRVQWPFVNISKNWGTVQQSYGAAQRVFEILAVTSEGVSSKQIREELKNQDFALDFSQVGFTYKGSEDVKDEKVLFHNLNLQVGKGEVVALVGPSGSGKTTVARLCNGLYIPDAGDIKVFDKSIVNELNEARALISYVPQTPYLFAGTVKENISYGREGVSDEEIVEAAKAANAHEFIEKLEKGYDSLIGERGVTLSGGQRQRLAIARAFVRKSSIIVLDEATSALDNESEYLVQQSMDRLMEHRSVLVIAHRLSTIRNANRIVVMNEGRITEEGTHEQLLELNGIYSELYNLQFSQH
jgi:ATP-binding cassette subfamily B protein/subfamily B ATP-binding cassette protein MsbA